MAPGVLSGVRILDLTRLLPGPFLTQYLAQLGAEVIKIEAPEGGDYARTLSPALFEQVNRGKASVTLDLSDADDVSAFMGLVADADVVIESFRPGVMARLGCDYDTLATRQPSLVYAALTGYGQTGPMASAAGHDINYLSLSGVLDQTGPARGRPALSNVQIADLAGGALTAGMAILAAVIGARSSGRGSFIDAAMLDGSLALQSAAFARLQASGHTQPRGADILTGALPNYRIYRCRDGLDLAVGALEPVFFKRLLAVLRGQDRPLMRPAPARTPVASHDNRRLVTRLERLLADPVKAARWSRPVHWALAGLFRTRSRAWWLRRLGEVDACVTPVLTLEDALAHPQVVARGMVEGAAPACPVCINGERPASLAQAPGLGQDNARLLNRP